MSLVYVGPAAPHARGDEPTSFSFHLCQKAPGPDAQHVRPTSPQLGSAGPAQYFAEDVLTNAGIDESSREEIRRRLRRHAFPELGNKAMRGVRPSMIQAWLRGRHGVLGEQTIKTVFQNLSMVFQVAVDDVEFLRHNVRVRRQIKVVHNRWVFAPPKGGKEREVPLPGHVADILSRHIAEYSPIEVTLPWRELGARGCRPCLVGAPSPGTCTRCAPERNRGRGAHHVTS